MRCHAMPDDRTNKFNAADTSVRGRCSASPAYCARPPTPTPTPAATPTRPRARLPHARGLVVSRPAHGLLFCASKPVGLTWFLFTRLHTVIFRPSPRPTKPSSKAPCPKVWPMLLGVLFRERDRPQRCRMARGRQPSAGAAWHVPTLPVCGRAFKTGLQTHTPPHTRMEPWTCLFLCSCLFLGA